MNERKDEKSSDNELNKAILILSDKSLHDSGYRAVRDHKENSKDDLVGILDGIESIGSYE